ncbi:MAG: hypothetical protein ACKO3T_17400 [Planctomycetaceae bacterium]
MSQQPALTTNIVAPASKQPVSGRTVVVLMFVMGILATAFLYTYWTLHLTPFMPLQEAIVREFPGSAPRVNGGRKKIHKQTPMILRVAIKSETDPTSEQPADQQAMLHLRQRIAAMTRELQPLPGIEQLEVHVYKLLKEDQIRKRAWQLLMTDDAQWQQMDETGTTATVQKPPATEAPGNSQ